MIPCAAGNYATSGVEFKGWEDGAGLMSALVYTRKGVNLFLPYRVVGFGLNVKSADNANVKAGTLLAGQLETTVATVRATDGGFLGNCSTTNGSNITYTELIDSLTTANSKKYMAEEGITVRMVMPKPGYRNFAVPAASPVQSQTTSMFFDAVLPANYVGYGVLPEDTGRAFFPTVLLEGAAAGSKWAVTAAIIIEVDNTFRELSYISSAPSPFCPDFEELLYLADDSDVYPAVSSGNSFWPSFKEDAKGVWRAIAPILVGTIAGELASPGGPVASLSASAAASQMARKYFRQKPEHKEIHKKKLNTVRVPRATNRRPVRPRS